MEEFEPLSPSHLICGRRINTFTLLHDYDVRDPLYADHNSLNKKFSMLSNILNKFKRIWQSEYLFSIREYHYGAISAKNISNIKVGDVVIEECDSPRGEWQLGRIEELTPHINGIIRSEVKELFLLEQLRS